MAIRRHMALIAMQDPPVLTGVLRGVREFFRTAPDWTLFYTAQADRAAIRWIKRDCDGVLVNLPDEKLHRSLRATGLPCVSMGGVRGKFMLPTITQNSREMAVLPAEYFLERGYRHFAYVRSSRWFSSIERGEGFAQRLARDGHAVRFYDPPTTNEPSQLLTSLSRWVRKLPRPIAVLAANDSLGFQVLDACRRLGISVPHELAIIGWGNNVELCNLCHPPLASVVIPYEKLGYQSAALLAKIVAGRRPPVKPIFLPMETIAVRQSAEAWAVDDPVISSAMRFILDHACDPVGVQDVAAHVKISYRRLLRRFDQVLGTNLHDEIRRVQLNRAKHLLTETDLPIREIARTCGWRDGLQIGRIFHQHVGVTPGSYRESRRPRV